MGKSAPKNYGAKSIGGIEVKDWGRPDLGVSRQEGYSQDYMTRANEFLSKSARQAKKGMMKAGGSPVTYY